MNSLNQEKPFSKEDYNNIPVFYCKHCLSLKVMGDDDMEYCDICGNTDIGSCSIEEWESIYEEKYGHKFINE